MWASSPTTMRFSRAFWRRRRRRVKRCGLCRLTTIMAEQIAATAGFINTGGRWKAARSPGVVCLESWWAKVMDHRTSQHRMDRRKPALHREGDRAASRYARWWIWRWASRSNGLELGTFYICLVLAILAATAGGYFIGRGRPYKMPEEVASRARQPADQRHRIRLRATRAGLPSRRGSKERDRAGLRARSPTRDLHRAAGRRRTRRCGAEEGRVGEGASPPSGRTRGARAKPDAESSRPRKNWKWISL